MRSNLKMILIAAFAACLTLSSATGQELTDLVVKKVDSKQPTRILLKNRFLELTFDPTRGGRCSRIVQPGVSCEVIADFLLGPNFGVDANCSVASRGVATLTFQFVKRLSRLVLPCCPPLCMPTQQHVRRRQVIRNGRQRMCNADDDRPCGSPVACTGVLVRCRSSSRAMSNGYLTRLSQRLPV